LLKVLVKPFSVAGTAKIRSDYFRWEILVLWQISLRILQHPVARRRRVDILAARVGQPTCEGCVLAALGPDISRADPSTRREVTKGIKNIVDCLCGLIPGKSRKRIREKSFSTYATIVGALVLARAVDEPDLSEEILNAALRSITNNGGNRSTLKYKWGSDLPTKFGLLSGISGDVLTTPVGRHKFPTRPESLYLWAFQRDAGGGDRTRS
jgi:hypothetical protein